MKKLKYLILNKWIQHSAFWVLSIYFIGSYFSISSIIRPIDYIYALFFHISLFVLVYSNLKYLIPYVLQKERYLMYTLATVLNIFLAYLIHQLTFEIVIPLLPIEYYIVSFTDLQVLITIYLSYTVITTLIKLSRSWFELQQAEKESLHYQVEALKGQINPHFLFNSLNSIYSLALAKSDETPEIVLKLSDLMRYTLYETNKELMDLDSEIAILNKYLDLQKIRSDENVSIKFTIDGDTENISLPPLLFLPLVENAFKHGIKGTSQDGYILMDLKILPDQIVFDIKNNKGIVDDPENKNYGGLGIENLQNRLKLQYADKHELIIKNNKEEFAVRLKLAL